MYERILNRLRWMTTGVEPERQTRPMRYFEALRFFREECAELDGKERQELIQWGMEHDQLRVDLPLNY